MLEGKEPNELVHQPNPEEPTQGSLDERDERHFPTARELVSKYIAELDIEEDNYGGIRHEIERAILYERAGRNLSNLGHHISAKLRRPVLALNNPRVGAFYQIGFKHWLENFGSQEKADQFVSELEDTEAYKETLGRLQELVEQFRIGLVQLQSNFGTSLPESSVILLQEIIDLPDPSIDIRLELISTQTAKNSRAGRQKRTFFGSYPPEHREYIDQYLDWLDSALLVINSIKDKLRSMIFHQSYEWLQADKMKSFVYPVNHWKLSSNGPKDIEIDRYGQSKLYQTVSLPETFILFSDAKRHYLQEPEKLAMRSGMRREFQGGLGNGTGWGKGEFANLVRGSKIISEALEYPLSPHAPTALASVQKRLIGLVDSETKALDIQGLFPDQDNKKQLGSNAMETDTGEISIDPSFIMKHSDMSRSVTRVIDDMQHRPEWLNSLKTRIPLEANYGYDGPEEA